MKLVVASLLKISGPILSAYDDIVGDSNKNTKAANFFSSVVHVSRITLKPDIFSCFETALRLLFN